MDMRKALGGNYLKASDCDPPKVLYIEGVHEETVEQDNEKRVKYVVDFRNEEKGLMLNKVNTNSIIEVLGYNSDNWYGCKLTLFATKTEFAGKMVDCVRVRDVKQSPEQAEAQAAQEPQIDDIPF